MSSSDSITIGPYTFTAHDAERTLGNFEAMWSSLVEGRDSASVDHLATALRERIAATSPLDERLADVWSTLRLATETLRANGQMPAMATGTVTQLSRSGGGVPKLAVETVDVDFRGVVGDVQRVRVHHGRPWQALCIYSDEVLAVLQAEGHPIERGSVGENITVSGLDWSDVRPGVLLQIGDVLALVQAYTTPCRKNARWFLGGEFNRMDSGRGPVSRVYATVLRPGRITTGDTIVLEPAQDSAAAHDAAARVGEARVADAQVSPA